MGCSIGTTKSKIHDGLYLITQIDTVQSRPTALGLTEVPVFFSPMFEDFNSEKYVRLVVDTTNYVPLELEKLPETEQETDFKKKLLLSLSPAASEKLKTFTTEHVMSHVALVVDGEALTMHKIRVPITSGQLQISRCNDNACELLFVKLQDSIKK